MARAITEYPFFAELCAQPFVEAIYVFGSHATGNADDRSDINLGILCPEASVEQWFELRRIVNAANILTRIDLARLDLLKPSPLQHYISQSRVPLYVRDRRDTAVIAREYFDATLKQVQEAKSALDVATDEKTRAEALKAFNETFRNFWLFTRRCLLLSGQRSNTPLSTLRHAMMEGWLTDRALWEGMMDDYTYAAGGLPDADIPAILQRIATYIPAIRKAAKAISADVLERERLTEKRA